MDPKTPESQLETPESQLETLKNKSKTPKETQRNVIEIKNRVFDILQKSTGNEKREELKDKILKKEKISIQNILEVYYLVTNIKHKEELANMILTSSSLKVTLGSLIYTLDHIDFKGNYKLSDIGSAITYLTIKNPNFFKDIVKHRGNLPLNIFKQIVNYLKNNNPNFKKNFLLVLSLTDKDDDLSELSKKIKFMVIDVDFFKLLNDYMGNNIIQFQKVLAMISSKINIERYKKNLNFFLGSNLNKNDIFELLLEISANTPNLCLEHILDQGKLDINAVISIGPELIQLSKYKGKNINNEIEKVRKKYLKYNP